MTLLKLTGRDGNKVAVDVDDISTVFDYADRFTKIWKKSGGFLEVLDTFEEVCKKAEDATLKEKGRQSIWKR